jgi:hypothetical protein
LAAEEFSKVPYELIASAMPLNAETIEAVQDGDLFPGVALPRTLGRFSEMTTILRGLGMAEARAEKMTKAAAKTLRRADQYTSEDGKIYVRKL